MVTKTSPILKDIVERAYRQGTSFQDIADALGIKRNAVGTICHNFKEKSQATAFNDMELTEYQLKLMIYWGRVKGDCKEFCKEDIKCNGKKCFYKLTKEYLIAKAKYGFENKRFSADKYRKKNGEEQKQKVNYVKLEQDMIKKFGRNFYTGR